MTQRDRDRLVLLKKAQKKLITHQGLISLMRRHRHNISLEKYQRLAEYLQQRPRWNRSPISNSGSPTCCSKKAATKDAATNSRGL